MYDLKDFSAGATYMRGDIVVDSGSLYECRQDTLGSPSIVTGTIWRKLPISGKAAQTIPTWSETSSYNIGDLVSVNIDGLHQLLYEALTTVPAGSPLEKPYWNMLNDISASPTGIPIFNGSEFKQRQWAVGDVIIKDNKLYYCSISYTSTDYWSSSDEPYWTELNSFPLNVYNFVAGKEYVVGDAVFYNNAIYVCIADHVSTSTFDENKFVKVIGSVSNFVPGGKYLAGITYLITIYSEIWISLVDHTNTGTATDPNIDTSKNKQLAFIFAGSGMNINYTHHTVGEMQIYNGELLYCKTSYNIPSGYIDLTKYDRMGSVPLPLFEWRPNVYYRKYYIVIKGGKVYYAVNDVYKDTFDLADWALIFVPTDWVANHNYRVGDCVFYNGKLYFCSVAHISVDPFDESKWILLGDEEALSEDAVEDEVPEIKLEDLPVQVKEFNVGDHYYVGDFIIFNGAIYKVTVDFIATSFSAAIPNIKLVLTDIPEFEPDHEYKVGDLILVDCKIFVCKEDHTSLSEFNETEAESWGLYLINVTLVLDFIVGAKEWQPDTDYFVGDIVLHNGKFYKCNTDHHSTTGEFEEDKDYWDCLNEEFDIPEWESGKTYNVGDIVLKDGKWYRCVTANTDSIFTPSKWVVITINDILEWQPSTNYSKGNYVTQDNKLYKCLEDHTSDPADFENDIDKWELIGTIGITYKENSLIRIKIKGKYFIVLLEKDFNIHEVPVTDFSNIEEWKPDTDYYVDDIVIHDGKLYKCNTDHHSNADFDTDINYWDDMGIKIIGESLLFSEFIDGKIYYIKDWQPDTDYIVGDVVLYNYKIYKCNTDHHSSQNFNDDISYWDDMDVDIEARPWQKNKSYSVGDGIVYDGVLFRVNTAFTSGDSFNTSNLDTITKLNDEIPEWQPDTDYKIGDVVKHWDDDKKCWKYYKCIKNDDGADLHHSRNVFDEVEQGYWEESPLYNQPNAFPGDSKEYAEGDIVKPEGRNSLYICIKPNIAGAFDVDVTSYWEPIATGVTKLEPKTVYAPNEVVIYDGFVIIMPDKLFITSNYIDQDFRVNHGFTLLALIINLLVEWKPNTHYDVGAVVFYGDSVYTCKTEHVSGDLFDDDELANWNDLGTKPLTIRPYIIDAKYNAGELIKINDDIYGDGLTHVYMAVDNFTASGWNVDGGTNTDKVLRNIPKWEPGKEYTLGSLVGYGDGIISVNVPILISINIKTPCMAVDLEEYEVDKDYDKNDMVIVNDMVFRATEPTTLTENDLKFIVLIGPSIREWQPNTDYEVNDIVKHDGTIYICINAHTSDPSDFENDADKWQKLSWEVVNVTPTDLTPYTKVSGSVSIPQWQVTYQYKVGDLVIFNWYIYQCKVEHLSGGNVTGPTLDNWDIKHKIDEWTPNTNYVAGDIIKHNGTLYVVVADKITTPSEFSSEGLKDLGVAADTDDETTAVKDAKPWEANKGYVVGNLVYYPCCIFKCIADHTSSDNFEDDLDNWEVVISGISIWKPYTTYKLGELVILNKDDGVIYRVITPHKSTGIIENPKFAKVGVESGSSTPTPVIPVGNMFDFGVVYKVTGSENFKIGDTTVKQHYKLVYMYEDVSATCICNGNVAPEVVSG